MRLQTIWPTLNSPGFKGVRPAFSSFLPPGGPTDKVMSGAVATTIDMRPGTTQPRIRSPTSFPTATPCWQSRCRAARSPYTRNGHIETGPDGVLQVAGLPLLDTSGEAIVVPEASEVTIESTGEVKAGTQVVGNLSLWSSQGPMDRVGASLMMPSAGTQMNQVTDGSVRVGELELGNVTALESTVQMIGAQRNYELAMQAIQTYRQLDQRIVDVGRVR